MNWDDFFNRNQKPSLKSLRENQKSYINELKQRLEDLYLQNGNMTIMLILQFFLSQIKKFMRELFLLILEIKFIADLDSPFKQWLIKKNFILQCLKIYILS